MVDLEDVRRIIIEVLREECSDHRASALALEEIEAKNIAGIVVERLESLGRPEA